MYRFEFVIDTNFQGMQALGCLLGAGIHFESCPCQEGKSTIYIDFTGLDDRKATAMAAFTLMLFDTTDFIKYRKD
jgi:hypothetical protein